MNTIQDFHKLVNDHEVARLLGVSTATMRRLRMQRQGPRYIKLGASVRYRPEDIASWLTSRPSGGASQQEAA